MATGLKTARTIQGSASNASGATATSSALNLTTALGCYVTAKITNGATGPALPCSFVIETSHDNSAWKTHVRADAGVANSGVYEFTENLPMPVQYVRSKFTGNTGQSVTVECLASELTSIG